MGWAGRGIALAALLCGACGEENETEYHLVSVSVSGLCEGVVTSTPGNIDCDVDCSSDRHCQPLYCTGTYEELTRVVLTAETSDCPGGVYWNDEVHAPTYHFTVYGPTEIRVYFDDGL